MKKRASIEAAFQKWNISQEWFVSQSQDHLVALARELSESFPVIVTVGGDTTFTLVASELLQHDTDAALGMAAAGSANDIARGLGTFEIDDLCRALASGSRRKIDVGLIEIPGGPEKTIFIGALSLGLGSEVSRYVMRIHQRYPSLSRGGSFAQTVAGVLGVRHAFSRKRVPARIQLKCREYEREEEFSLIVFANSPYYANGFLLAPDSEFDNGRLSCFIIRSSSLFRTALVASKIPRGRHFKCGEVDFLSDSRFELTSNESLDLQYDGEILEGVDRFTVSVLPAALTVV